jgi:hypothetical protein
MHIRYQDIPEEFITDFKNNIDRSLTLTTQHDTGEISYLDGGPSDIIIFIEEHLTEIIIGGILIPAIYDGLKLAIKRLWIKIVKYYSKQNTVFEEDKNFIELNFKIKPDKTIIFNLKGNIDDKLVDKITENLFEYLKDLEKHKTDFNNPDYQSTNEDDLNIIMIFNTTNNTWEPFNYSNINKKMGDMFRKAIEDSEN